MFNKFYNVSFKRNTLVKKCRATGKVYFSTKTEARLTIYKLRWIYRHPLKNDDGTRMKRLIKKKPAQKRFYYCKFCNGYHLTKYPYSVYQKIRREIDAFD